MKSKPSQIRVPGAGLGYVLLILLVAVAATNTGNNALFLVLALMLAFLSFSGLISRWNLRGLEVSVKAPEELYANRPSLLQFEVKNRSSLLPHWFLMVHGERRERARLVPMLPRGGQSRGWLELLRRRRGRHRLRDVHVASPFPFGFFRKAQAYAVNLDLLVYPELFEGEGRTPGGIGDFGTEGASQQGRGQDLRQLRKFRTGDDPRNIHWKQTAKTGSLIFMEKEERQGKQVSVIFDNGVAGTPLEERDLLRFEQLVSEAATVAVEMLDRGYEVELLTRDERLPFGSGRRQRFSLLEALALVEPVVLEKKNSPSTEARSSSEPLAASGSQAATSDLLTSSDSRVPEIRFALERGVDP